IVLRAKLVLNPVTISKSQPDRLVAFGESGSTPTDVSDLAAFFFPVTTEQILETRSYRAFELLDLRRCLIGDLFGAAVKQPPGVAGVCLNRANTSTDELGALAIGILDVVEEARGKLRHAVFKRGEEALADRGLHTEILWTTERGDGAIDDLLRLFIDRDRRRRSLNEE